ncbi:MAG: agmatinase [Planctomycetota bacterium]
MPFDPNAAAAHDSFFGLPEQPDAAVQIIPVEFEGTVSYRSGTAHGPAAMRAASQQVDLLDQHFGDVWKAGLHAQDALKPTETDPDAAAESIRMTLRRRVADCIAAGRIPATLGGEHSVSLGAIEAAADSVPSLGVIQIDAHMDLRDSFEGYRYSHASVMRNVIEHCPTVTRLVQIGVRDFCEEEIEFARASEGRVSAVFDADLWDVVDSGRSVRAFFDEIVASLPEHLYISFDIDGLDPSLCPSTGTPVPGGMTFNQACALLRAIAESGRRVIGFDLVEVAPGKDNEWDANVGARLLYKLAGCALASQGRITTA